MSFQAQRRLLVLNPNTSVATSQRLESVLRPQLPADVQLTVCTATTGARYIACEASHAVAGYAALNTWAAQRLEHPAPLHGVLIGCFGDPGLFALRECSGAPVTGLAEASFILAAQRGPFSVVTGGERWGPMLVRLAQALGMGSTLKHVHTVAPSGAQMLADPAMALRHLQQACAAAAVDAGVQSIIVGGAGLAGYAAQLQAHVKLPLIDSVDAGLRVLLERLGPPALHPHDVCHADWGEAPAALHALARG